MSCEETSVVVVGGGPAGLTAAIALAAGGMATTLVGKRPATTDNRTTALLAGSVTALSALGVWDFCADQAAPLKTLRIVDDTGRLWRAPEVKFDASEIGLAAFGHNIENRHLMTALDRRARALDNLRLVDDEVREVRPGDRAATITLKSGASLQAPLVVGADGRRSLCRAAAGLTITEQHYPQIALTLCLRHARPHRDTSTEFHAASGPFTLVPLPGQRSSVVWVLDPADAVQCVALDDDALSEAIERASHSILGKIQVDEARGCFPLHRGAAGRFAARRVALVGEAAHVIPPIGAQGLNLGLRDAAAVAEFALAARRRGRDIGGVDVLDAYHRMRRSDIASRSLAVDWLNRALLTDFLPLHGARGLGLYMLSRAGPLRRALMHEGVAPRRGQPRLMRGEAI